MKILKNVVFVLYIFCVLYLTLIDRTVNDRKMELLPFWELANVIKGVERWFYIRQIICNIIMLIPLGFIIPMYFDTNWKKILIFAALFSMSIELTQYFTGRGLMEFDDVFNNSVGAVIGYLIYNRIRSESNEKV